MEGGAWGLVIVISAFMIQMVSFGTSAAIGVYNIELLDYFKGEALGVSLIGSINLGINLGSGPIVSFLMTKYRYRTIALCGSILVTGGLLALPFLPYIPTMCLFYGLLTGFGNCCVYIPSHVLSGLYYEKYRSLATGISTSGSGLGGAVMPVMAGYLVNEFSWKGSLVVIAGLNLHLFIFAALLRPPESPSPSWDQNALTLNGPAAGIDAAEVIAMQVIVNDITVIEDDEGYNFLGLDSSELDFVENTSRPASFSSTETLVNTRMHKYGSLGRRPKSLIASIGEETTLPRVIKSSSSGLKVPRSSSDTYRLAPIPMSMGWRGSSIVFVDTPRDLTTAVINESFIETDTVSSNIPATVPLSSRHIFIFTNYEFDVYFLSNVMWNAGYSILQSFAPEFLRERGLTLMETAWLSGTFGLGAFIGGILGGILGNVKGVNRQFFYTLANVAMGGTILLLPYGDKKPVYIVILLSSGLSWGIILGLLLVVLTDLVGVESLGNGLGYLMLSNGLGTVAGPPIASLLQNDEDGFGPSILLAGAVCIMGGMVMLLMPCHQASSCTKAKTTTSTNSNSNANPITSV